MNRVINSSIAFSTPWFDIVSKTIEGEKSPYYVLQTLDYVSILATTIEGQVLLVKQYRPVVEHVTLELPSGHIDNGESPEQAARRELLEETGYQVQELELLGTLAPDVGRLGNRLWCFFAPRVMPAARALLSDKGEIEVVHCSPAQLSKHIQDGQFNHALNLAAILLAVRQGSWQFT